MAKHVLVVDDHPAVALALRIAFKRDRRFELTGSAATAAEGLERLDGQDVVLLDLHLPDLAGVELVRAFRERMPDLPLVLHTADDDTPEIAAVRPLVDAVVQKNRIEDLLVELARVTGA
jgi:two-component system, NarL family, competent response regulator ComA